MPKIAYIERQFNKSTAKIIDQANTIIVEYSAAGYDLTLRQLYYQFVSRDLLKNTQKEYKRLGSIINDGRLAGLIDWDAITDRTRFLTGLSHWDSPGHIVASCAAQFRVDKWKTQPIRVEVWIEKEALAGVFQRVCNTHDIPYFSCKGYTSQSEMWAAARRLKEHVNGGQGAVILHFGDHDPSGLDMTRDIRDRLKLFHCPVEIHRLGLNMDQIEEYAPPPNPAKATDARFDAYQDEFGDESWELDALEPKILADLVSNWILANRDEAAWKKSEALQEKGRKRLREVSKTV
jgi:hypothetical protein